jgi:preprotein translocase subunit YajC
VELASLLPIVGIALLFWFLLIRPANRRQRETRQMQASLQVGDEVMLTSGIYAVIRSLSDDRVTVEVSPGVSIEVARGAIGTVVTGQPADEPVDSDPTEPTAEDR